MEKPTVFVPHLAMRRMPDNSLEPVHDLTPCQRFGEMQVVFKLPLAPRGGGADAMAQHLIHAREMLRGFNDRDSIVATGDPAAIALVVMVAEKLNRGRVALLRWDRWSKAYQRLQLDLSNERRSDEEA